MDKVKSVVAEWLNKQYGPRFEKLDNEFGNLEKVPILHTTDGENDEHTVEVFADLTRHKFLYFYDRQHVGDEDFRDTTDFLEFFEYMSSVDAFRWCLDARDLYFRYVQIGGKKE